MNLDPILLGIVDFEFGALLTETNCFLLGLCLEIIQGPNGPSSELLVTKTQVL